MAHLEINDDRLCVVLSRWEKAGALRRSDVTVRMSAVSGVTTLENAREAIRGIRVPGTGLPGVIALGTWRTRKFKDFVAVTRDDPGYLIALDGEPIDRIVVSFPPIPVLDALI